MFVASIIFIILALCIIPIAFHFRHKLEQLVVTVGQLKDKFEALAEDSHTMVRNVTDLSKRANQQLDEVDHMVRTARGWTERADRLVNEVGSAVEPPVHSAVRNMNLFRTGVTTFLQVLLQRNQHNQTKKE